MIELNKWQEPLTSSTVILDSVLHVSVSMVDFTCFYTDVNFCYQYKNTETNPAYGYMRANDIFNLVKSIRKKCKDKLWNYLVTDDGAWVEELWFHRETNGMFSVWSKNWTKQFDITKDITECFDWEFNNRTYDTRFINS